MQVFAKYDSKFEKLQPGTSSEWADVLLTLLL